MRLKWRSLNVLVVIARLQRVNECGFKTATLLPLLRRVRYEIQIATAVTRRFECVSGAPHISLPEIVTLANPQWLLIAIGLDSTTLRSAIKLCLTTQPGPTISLSVLVRSSATRPVPLAQQLVGGRSSATRPAVTRLLLASTLVRISHRRNNIDVGNAGLADEASTIRIGDVQTATYIAGINGTPVTGEPVVVDANGQLGPAASSARFKKEIKPMDKTSEAILALKPVSFHYKTDRKGTPQFGLIAEEVAKVNPDLVVRDRKGEIYSVRYEAVNAMLLNEFLKEHKTVQELESVVALQQKQIEALTGGLQKVSAQVEVNKAAPKTVLNNR